MKGKLLFVFIFLTYLSSFVFAQDIITRLNGDEIQAKVTEVNTEEVKYRKFSNLTGPIYTMLQSDIFMIKYEDGSKDIFEKNSQTGQIVIRHIANPNPVQATSVNTPVAQTPKSKDTTPKQTTQPVAATKPVETKPAEVKSPEKPKENITPLAVKVKGGKGSVKFENETYTVQVGKISQDGKGKTLVELSGDKIGGTLLMRNNRMIIPVGMDIVVNGKTISYDNCSVNKENYVFYFATSGTPEKIVVYGNEGSYGSKVTFDVIPAGSIQNTPIPVSSSPPVQKTETKVYDAKSGEHDIVDLIENKIVEVEVQGRDITYVNVNVRKLVDYPVSVRIPVGSYFVSANTSSQNMVATAEKKVRLTGEGWQNVSVSAACANRPKNIPDSKDRFTVTRSPHQAELAKLMPVLEKANVGTTTKQAAVWIITDNASYNDLGILVSGNGRAIGARETAHAMKICSEAGIDITKKRIWADRNTILEKLSEGSLKSWLQNK